MPEFKWVNTILGNIKTSLGGTHHAFKFAKYGTRYLAAFAYRFNRRFRLDLLPARLLAAAVCAGPRPEQWLRSAEASCSSGNFLICPHPQPSPIGRGGVNVQFVAVLGIDIQSRDRFQGTVRGYI